MKNDHEKMPNCFRWIRAAQARYYRETKDMTDDEWVAYSRARMREFEKNRLKITPEEAQRRLDAILHGGETLVPSRKARAKTAAKKPVGRRKTPKQLTRA